MAFPSSQKASRAELDYELREGITLKAAFHVVSTHANTVVHT